MEERKAQDLIQRGLKELQMMKVCSCLRFEDPGEVRKRYMSLFEDGAEKVGRYERAFLQFNKKEDYTIFNKDGHC